MSPRTIIGPNGQTVIRGGRHSVHNRKACNTCRQRKGRCDGNGVDPCSWCLSKSHTCNYNPEDGRGPSWNKQAIESHKNLEKNLLATNEALLSQLSALKAYIRQLGGSPPPELSRKLEEKDDVQALCEQTRHLVLQDDKQFSLHGEWSPWVNMGPSRPAITTPMSPPRADGEPDTFDYRSAIYSMSNAWRRYLPEDAVIDAAEHDRTCDLFFKFFHSWGLRTIAQLYWRDMYRAIISGEDGPPPRTAHWSPFLHNAILSVALSLSDKPAIRARQNRDKFAKKAKRDLERECSAPLISTLSGFFCLGTYHSTLKEQSLAFVYLGISVRMCRALGLNVSCAQWVESGHITKADELDRHWGFWMTYCQEIWWSLYLGREFSLNIANASIPIPTPESLPRDDIPWVLPGVDDVPRKNMYNEGFVEGCRLCIIVTKIMQTVYGLDRRGPSVKPDEVQKISTELNEWYAALPPILMPDYMSLPHILMLHLAFWWCKLLLHRPVYRLDRNPESTARLACIQAADKVCELIDHWKARYTLRFVPVTMMSIIFTAGTTWVLAASELHQTLEQRQQYLLNAAKCVGHLEHAERLWDSASQLRLMLARLLAEQQVKIQMAELAAVGTDGSGGAAVGSGGAGGSAGGGGVGAGEHSSSTSISSNSTRNPTPAPIITSSSRMEGGEQQNLPLPHSLPHPHSHTHPLPHPHTDPQPQSVEPIHTHTHPHTQASYHTPEAHYSPQTETHHHYTTTGQQPQPETHFNAQYRYSQGPAGPAGAAPPAGAYIPAVWGTTAPAPGPGGGGGPAPGAPGPPQASPSTNRIPQPASMPPPHSQFTYAHSNPSQLPTQSPAGPPDWHISPHYWMAEVGDTTQARATGNNFYAPPPGPQGPY